eukprot:763077-Hanusia_phi.AAC.7
MYLVVGCGLSGTVIAERIANVMHEDVLIIEKRNHIAGNCFDYIDEDTGILCNLYGPHIFHTNDENVWKYINKFDDWIRWEHKVLSCVDDKYVPVPINITTINELFNENIQNSYEMNEWLKQNQIKKDVVKNSEDVALSRIGKKLYNMMIKEYTFKQWAKYPCMLDKEVLERIPVRDNFDSRYFNDKYQALPKYGYTHFVKCLINNPRITCKLNIDFSEFSKTNDLTLFDKVIYTGPIDQYFDFSLDKLEYRSISFHKEIYMNTRYYQQNAVVNYPEAKYPFTRITEYKHFLHQTSDHTIIFKETTTDEGEPYYPVPTQRNKELYEKYKAMAEKESNVIFAGRLANYKYFNMDQAINNALILFESMID